MSFAKKVMRYLPFVIVFLVALEMGYRLGYRDGFRASENMRFAVDNISDKKSTAPPDSYQAGWWACMEQF